MGKNELQYGVVQVTSTEAISNLELERLRRHAAHYAPEVAQMQWESQVDPSIELTAMSVRRVNIANIGQNATASLRFSYLEDITWRDFRAWHTAAIDVLDTRQGDVIIEASGMQIILAEENYCQAPAPRHTSIVQEEKSSRAQKPKKHQSVWRDIMKGASEHFPGMMSFQIADKEDAPAPAEARVQTLEEQEDEQIAALDLEQQRAIEDIQAAIIRYVSTYHADPQELLLQLQGKIIVDNQPSPLVVNQDMKIVLSHYNEIAVELPALIKSVYILFLLHPEGIVLKNFGDYRNQLEEIYNIVMPARNEQLARESLDNLCDPLSNTLNEYRSKIKKSFKRYILGDELLEQYVITGRRGQPFRIALNRDLVTLPAVFR